MGSATLAALKGKMNTLILKKAPGTRIHGKPEDPRHKEPEYPTLNEHLWALVLQHLDNLQDRIKASACCRAAWKAALLKVKITIDVPAAGMSKTLCINLGLGLCVLHMIMNMKGIVIPCPW